MKIFNHIMIAILAFAGVDTEYTGDLSHPHTNKDYQSSRNARNVRNSSVTQRDGE